MKIKFLSRRLITILTIILLLLNIIVGIFIFFDIQIIKAPKTEVFVNILEVTSDEILIETTIEMTNPNNFEVSFSNLKLITLTKDNIKIGEIEFDGGSIPSDETQNFYSKDKIYFQEEGDFSLIRNKITGNIGINLLGLLQKTIPIEVSVIASIQEIINSINIPEIKMKLDFNNITQNGIEFTVKVEIYNPTKIEFGIDEFSIFAMTEEKEEVGSLIIFGDIVKPKESSIFTSKGSLHYNAFDSDKIIFTLNGIARGKIGGLEKRINISTDTELIIPDITEFIFKNEPIEFQIPVQFKFRLNGIVATVGFRMFNPSEVPLEGRDLVCKIYRMDNEQRTLLGQKDMQTCTIDPHDRVCVKSEIIIPYISYLLSKPFKLLPDWIILNIEGYFSIAGTRQEFPISLNAFVDPILFREKEQIFS